MTYKIQIDSQVRDATTDEAARIEATQNEPTLQDRINARDSALESARAKLAKLGLTDDELAAIFGA